MKRGWVDPVFRYTNSTVSSDGSVRFGIEIIDQSSGTVVMTEDSTYPQIGFRNLFIQLLAQKHPKVEDLI